MQLIRRKYISINFLFAGGVGVDKGIIDMTVKVVYWFAVVLLFAI